MPVFQINQLAALKFVETMGQITYRYDINKINQI